MFVPGVARRNPARLTVVVDDDGMVAFLCGNDIDNGGCVRGGGGGGGCG